MPSSEVIVEQLATATHTWQAVASGWHVLLGAFLVSLMCGWRPPSRLVGTLLVLPLVSVSLIAWWSGNLFNAVVFAALAMTIAGLAGRLRAERISVAPPRFVWPGATLIGFGWIYPHFFEAQSWWPYLFATPLGVVPCPTLATTVGLSLVLGAFGSSAWAAVLASAGIFYGVVGVIRLGVTIDITLFVGAIVLARVAVHMPESRAPDQTGDSFLAVPEPRGAAEFSPPSGKAPHTLLTHRRQLQKRVRR
jgi:hypothetical protein